MKQYYKVFNILTICLGCGENFEQAPEFPCNTGQEPNLTTSVTNSSANVGGSGGNSGNGGFGGEIGSGGATNKPECTFDDDCLIVTDEPCKIGICIDNMCQTSSIEVGTPVHLCTSNVWDAYSGICSFNGEVDIIYFNNCSDICNPNLLDSICSNICGNGRYDGGSYENCDDGNLSNNDGCDFNCQIELGWSCEHIWISQEEYHAQSICVPL